MTGTLRMLLAMLVAAVHFRPTYLTINVLGSAALVSFFVISGYAMTGLYDARFAGRDRGIRLFYLDRFLRIAPQYYFWMCVAAIMLVISHSQTTWRAFPFLQSGSPGLFNVLCNLLIFPMGFWPYFSSLASFQLVPPAWSLTIEIAFYLLLPAMARWAWLNWAMVLVSGSVMSLATLGLIDPVLYEYRSLPAPLLYILIGFAMGRRHWRLLGAIYALSFVDFVAVLSTGKLLLGLNPGIFLGISVGAAMVWCAAILPAWRLDDPFGRCSYGCYLGHWSLLVIVWPHSEYSWRMLAFAMACGVLGWFSYRWVDARVLMYRRRLSAQVPPEVMESSRIVAQEQPS